MIWEKLSKISHELSKVCIFRIKGKLRSGRGTGRSGGRGIKKKWSQVREGQSCIAQRCRAKVLRKAK